MLSCIYTNSSDVKNQLSVCSDAKNAQNGGLSFVYILMDIIIIFSVCEYVLIWINVKF